MPIRHLILTLLCFCSQCVLAASDSFKVHADFPYLNKEDKLLLDVFYYSDTSFRGILNISFFRYRGVDDSECVLSKRLLKFPFRQGNKKVKLDISTEDSSTYYAPKFYEVLSKTNDIAPGSYKIFFTVKGNNHVHQSVYVHDVDSALTGNSSIRHAINKKLAPRSMPRSVISSRLPISKLPTGENSVSRAKHKIDKIARKRGLTTNHSETNSKICIDFYYADWFAGRYAMDKSTSIATQADDQEMAATNPNSDIANDLDHPSLMSQYKKKNTEKRAQEDTKGEIGVNTNLSSDQEPSSGMSNNYLEVRGRTDLTVSKIPISLEGLYTSQDNNRTIKSSYFRVHYDVEKMKEGLSKSIAAYNSKFNETKSKGTGMSQIYKTAINRMESQRSGLQNEINAQGKHGGQAQPDYIDLGGKVSSSIPRKANDTAENEIVYDETKPEDSTSYENDTTNAARKKKHKMNKADVAENKRKMEQKKKEAEELDRKIKKYKTLLAQSENTEYFDSKFGYDKTKNLGNSRDISYKEMAKGASCLLPDGKAKSFLSGVTTMDAGMFSKSDSKYTMAGQMMKGADFGYDLGFCEAGIAAGKTEYVGRDGNLDKYTFYSGKVSFKPAKAQKVQLMYYGYSADRKISGDQFFKQASISAPAFFDPVHIISANYEGSISQYITVNTEAATSIKQSDKDNVPALHITNEDKMAYHAGIEGNIPKTAITLETSYDKTGKYFENSTLPVLLKGTEQYKVAGSNDFFRGVLTTGVEYNCLIQNNFTSKGKNTKWGFNVKTNFKRYPNVSLSYKPFTTFRLYTDTFNIPQKPMLGEVWTGKATYNIRHHEKTLRLTMLYNQSLTTIDTTKYGSKLALLSAMYSNKHMSDMVAIGSTQIIGPATNAVVTTPAKMYFLNTSVTYAFSKALSITAGQDFGWATFGICRYSASAGTLYRFKKPRISTRFNFRYSTYKLEEGTGWKNIYSGNVDVVYSFKIKNSKENKF